MPVTFRLVVMATFCALALHAEDIAIPMDDATIVVRVDLSRGFAYKVKIPDTSQWQSVQLRIDLGGLCDGKPHQWSVPITVTPKWILKDLPYVGEGTSTLEGADDCTIEIIRGVLISAKSETRRIEQNETQPADFTDELKAIAKKEAARLARAKQLAAERKRKEDAEAARLAKVKAEEALRAAEEKRKVRIACGAIYENTIDKKIKDLTVREEQQVRACQALDLYPPR